MKSPAMVRGKFFAMASGYKTRKYPKKDTAIYKQVPMTQSVQSYPAMWTVKCILDQSWPPACHLSSRVNM